MATSTGIERAGSVSLGVTVVLLYAIFVTAVFSGFASYIYRSEWQSTLAENADVRDLDNLIYIVKREAMLERALIDARAEARTLRDDQRIQEATRDKAFSQLAKIEAAREKNAFHDIAEFRGIDDRLDEPNQIALDAILGDGDRSVRERADDAFTLFERAVTNMAAEDAEKVNGVLDTMRARRDRLALNHTTQTELALEAKALISAALGKLEEISALERRHSDRLAAFREQVPLGSPERARLDALTISVPGIGNMFQRLVSFPTIFLTLIVTIAAGGLGAVVGFSRRYYVNPEGLSLSRLFVNVGEGIAAAIAIFLFSGAGMLALTQGSGAQNSVELSPYTVAFIAFLSGFMAEEAFGSIQSAGKRIFKPDDPPENGGHDNRGPGNGDAENSAPEPAPV